MEEQSTSGLAALGQDDDTKRPHVVTSSPKKPSLHDLTREKPTPAEFTSIMGDLVGMEHRACALILASLLDNFLEQAIATNFVELSKSRFDELFRSKQAPLAHFAAKISVAFALGALTDEGRSQLDRIRGIRNAFAHSISPIDFDHPIIAEACKKLDPARLTGAPFEAPTPKEKFLGAGLVIGILLLNFTEDRIQGLKSGTISPPSTYRGRFAQF